MIIPKEKLTKVKLPTVSNNVIEPSRGLGDLVKKVLHPIVKGTRLENCKGCNDRKEKLNKLFPYNNKQDKQPPT